MRTSLDRRARDHLQHHAQRRPAFLQLSTATAPARPRATAGRWTTPPRSSPTIISTTACCRPGTPGFCPATTAAAARSIGQHSLVRLQRAARLLRYLRPCGWNMLGLVYLDAGTCDVDLHHNLLWAAPGSHQRGMWFNTCCVGIREHDNVFHQEFRRDSGRLRPDGFSRRPAVPVRPRLRSTRPPCPSGRSWSNSDWRWNRLPRIPRAWQKHPAGQPAGKTAIGLRSRAWISARAGKPPSCGWPATPRSHEHRQARRAPPASSESDRSAGAGGRVQRRQPGQVRKQWTFLYNHRQQGLGSVQASAARAKDIGGSAPSMATTAPLRGDWRCDWTSRTVRWLAKSTLPQTDRYRGNQVQIYSEAVAELSPTAPARTTYFWSSPPATFHAAEARLPCQLPHGDGRRDGPNSTVDFEYLRFEQYRGELPLQKNEVKLELRAGSKDGPKLGEFYPRFTGGADRFRNLWPAGAGAGHTAAVCRRAFRAGPADRRPRRLRLEKGVDVAWT